MFDTSVASSLKCTAVSMLPKKRTVAEGCFGSDCGRGLRSRSIPAIRWPIRIIPKPTFNDRDESRRQERWTNISRSRTNKVHVLAPFECMCNPADRKGKCRNKGCIARPSPASQRSMRGPFYPNEMLTILPVLSSATPNLSRLPGPKRIT